MSDDDDDFLIEDDAPDASPPAQPAAPWTILVVDDDVSVHSITRLVLGDVRFMDRPLHIISAHTSREAASILRKRTDIALILLDVVMESDDAGLRLVREVRETIGNKAVRIILRTGEPGQAPERRVILDYDINDYKAKADLTAQQLYTATIAALRGYADLRTLEESRQGLATLFRGTAQLFATFDLAGFAAASLRLVVSLFDGPVDAALLLRTPEGWSLLAGHGALEGVAPEILLGQFGLALAVGAPLSGPHLELRPIRCVQHKSACLLVIPASPVSRVSRDLLDLVSATIGIGLDNGALHQALLDEQSALERRVQERTAELAASQSLMEEDLRAAGVLQQAFLPEHFPPHPNVEGAAIMRPARSIGGDFHDVMALDDHHMALLVGDVSGKGAQAALFMVLARTMLQEVMSVAHDPAAIMAETNRRLLLRNPLSLFVTVMFCVLNARTGHVRFCSAGHGMPLIRRADGSVKRVEGRPSPMLGLIDAASYSGHELQLDIGDALVLATDGIEEATDVSGAWFGADRFSDALASAGPGASASAILAATTAALDAFCIGAALADDVTCVVARWTPPTV